MSRTALVTGASSGIGEAFAKQLAAKGWDLVLVARSTDRLRVLADELIEAHRVSVEVLPADLIDSDALQSVCDRLESIERPIELLVNNAGIGTEGAFTDQTRISQIRMVDLNVRAVVALAHAAATTMVGRASGQIINVSSIGGFQAAPGFAVYAASKSFVTGFSTALYEEVRGSGVVVSALCPGFTRTEFQQNAGMEPSTMPDIVWQEPAEVVATALAGLKKRKAIVIPGLLNRLTVGFVKLLPSAAARKLAKLVVKQK
jgi:short-subunit dehydrogenase